MPRRIESLLLAGPAGKLEALLEEPEDRDPQEAFVVCHPHPQHGGTMHNKVVYRMARGLRRSGAVVLRFNYRGVNMSEGKYDHGTGEMDDTRAAVEFLTSRYPDLSYSMAGFSFGSRIVLKLGCELGNVARLIAVGLPASYTEAGGLDECPAPRIIIQSTHDQFGPRPAIEAYFERLAGPKQLVWVEAGDHFFAGALPEFEEVVFRVAGSSRLAKSI